MCIEQLCARWVPRLITMDQKLDQQTISPTMLFNLIMKMPLTSQISYFFLASIKKFVWTNFKKMVLSRMEKVNFFLYNLIVCEQIWRTWVYREWKIVWQTKEWNLYLESCCCYIKWLRPSTNFVPTFSDITSRTNCVLKKNLDLHLCKIQQIHDLNRS